MFVRKVFNLYLESVVVEKEISIIMMQKGKLVHDIAASDAVAALSVEKSHAQSFIFIHIEKKKKPCRLKFVQ